MRGLHVCTYACGVQWLIQGVLLDCCPPNTLTSLTWILVCTARTWPPWIISQPLPPPPPPAFALYSFRVSLRAIAVTFRETLPQISSRLSQARTRNQVGYSPLFVFAFKSVIPPPTNAYTNISINCYLKITVPQGSICLALNCFGCVVLGWDGRHGKSAFPLSSHEIAKCGFRTLPAPTHPASFKTHSHCRLYFCLPGVCWSDKSRLWKLSHSVMFLSVIPSSITLLFKF